MIRSNLLLLCLIWSAYGFGQFKDAGLWTSFSLKGDINKKLSFGITPELRLNENISQVARAFVDYGAQYKLHKYLFATATWRGGQANTGEYFETRRRLQLGLGTRHKTDLFAFSFQSRWQLSSNPNRAETDIDFTTTWRNKIAVKYTAVKKTDFSTSFELFHREGRVSTLELTDWRWTASVERKINKRNFIEIGYLIQKNIVESPQEIDYVVLLSYTVELDLKKKKKGNSEDKPSPVSE
jgi:hypothetical protein